MSGMVNLLHNLGLFEKKEMGNIIGQFVGNKMHLLEAK